MKNNRNLSNGWNAIIACLGLMTILSACDAKYTEKSNALFISEAHGLEKTRQVSVNETGGKAAITPVLSSLSDQPVTAEVGISAEVLEEYNKKSMNDYHLLPADFYEFSTQKVTIEAGKISTSPIQLNIKALTKEMIDSGATYAIPVTLKNAEGVELLSSAQSLIYVLRQVIVTTAPKLNSSTPIKLKIKQESLMLTEWTIEFRVNMSVLGTAVGQYNNQAIFAAGDGVEASGNEIYVRFGDSSIEGNRLQVKAYGTQVNCNKKCEQNKWYHIAITSDGHTMKVYFDGELDASMATPRNSLLVKSPCTIMAAGSYFIAKMMISEFRLWTKVRTPLQLKNNMYAVSVKSDGLEGYWRLNEGSGKTFFDSTGNGNDGACEVPANFEWVPIRSDDK